MIKAQTLSQKIIENHIGNKKDPAFTGVLDIATSGLQLCNEYPMIGVGFKDIFSTGAPRSIEDFKDYGFAAARETVWRESSGLLVNCFLPSFFVLGVGALANKSTLGKDFQNVNMAKSWANQDTLEKFASVFKSIPKEITAEGTHKTAQHFVEGIFSDLEGLKDNSWVNFSEILDNENGKKAVKKLTEAIANPNMGKKATKSALKEACKEITSLSGVSETLRFKSDKGKIFTSNLTELLRDQIDLGRKFSIENVGTNIENFVKKSTRLVNLKSLIGLAVIIPLAMSMQYINRAITKKKYGKDGPPVYKDFEKRQEHKLGEKEKKELFTKKIISAAALSGLVLASMMKKPNIKMFQFKGMFPTVDQCRNVTLATFLGRIFTSGNLKELGMNTRREIGTYSCLYFLGNYISKATGTLIEKINPKIKLINRLSTVEANANIFKKLGNWVTGTRLKSFDEARGKLAKNMRSVCELADLGFSMLGLGVLLTKFNNARAEKFDQKQAKKLKAEHRANKAQDKTAFDGSKNVLHSSDFSAWKELKNNKAFSKIASGYFK